MIFGYTVFVRRPVFPGTPWEITIPGVGNTEVMDLAEVVKAARGLISAHLGKGLAEIANEHLDIWVRWEAVLEHADRIASGTETWGRPAPTPEAERVAAAIRPDPEGEGRPIRNLAAELRDSLAAEAGGIAPEV